MPDQKAGHRHGNAWAQAPFCAKYVETTREGRACRARRCGSRPPPLPCQTGRGACSGRERPGTPARVACRCRAPPPPPRLHAQGCVCDWGGAGQAQSPGWPARGRRAVTALDGTARVKDRRQAVMRACSSSPQAPCMRVGRTVSQAALQAGRAAHRPALGAPHPPPEGQPRWPLQTASRRAQQSAWEQSVPPAGHSRQGGGTGAQDGAGRSSAPAAGVLSPPHLPQ